MPYAIATMMATLAFFLGLSLLLENPFERWWILPDRPESRQVVETALIPAGAIAPARENLAASATGLNPLLRHFGMIIHPPMLYLGFVGFTIPFAFALAALASGDLSTGWIKATRRWTLIAWVFLSLGLIWVGAGPMTSWAGAAIGVGTRSKTRVFALAGWHGFYPQCHDPGKARHAQNLEYGAGDRDFFGGHVRDIATRSGVIESVHSFARSEIGFPMLAFWALMTLIALTLLLWRWQRGELRGEHQFANILSRETMFVLNNVIFIALFAAIFWGSFGLPIISELFMGVEVTIGPATFEFFVVPLFVAMYILMGIAPLSAWGSTSVRRLGMAIAMPFSLAILSVLLLMIAGTGALVLSSDTAWHSSRDMWRFLNLSRRAGAASGLERELDASCHGALPTQPAPLRRLYCSSGRDGDRDRCHRQHSLPNRGSAYLGARRDDHHQGLRTAL